MPRPAPPAGDWQQGLREGALRLGVPLSPESLGLFERYMAELLRWQARANLTGFRTPRAIAQGGFLDSLACLRALPQGPLRIVDIGSGAGFPGLPIRIVRPGAALTLVEANRRRHSFLAHACRTLGLADVQCLHGRAETVAAGPGLRASFDVAFARAVRQLQAAAELAAGFLRPGGIFVSQQPAEAAERPPRLEGYGACATIAIPSGETSSRALLVYPRTP
ncbi:MAG TPA: 16S rRNA (guanine(527)-N(7))-methyltransferase RsmG [Candidatus Sulfotelmatobacter sp.]|nr:16S rRNA (guanine(527)-N(7))-methyltransferase RsmG [Candidatus Sulfotelmatobacter sp.]